MRTLDRLRKYMGRLLDCDISIELEVVQVGADGQIVVNRLHIGGQSVRICAF